MKCMGHLIILRIIGWACLISPFITPSFAPAQQSRQDSLETILSKWKSIDTARVNALNQLSHQIAPSDPVRAGRIADSARVFAERLRYHYGVARANLMLARASYFRALWKKALGYARESYRLFIRMKDSVRAMRARLFEGASLRGMNEMEAARTAIFDCLRWGEERGDEEFVADAFSELAYSYKSSDRRKALDFLGRALRLYEKRRRLDNVASALLTMGSISLELGDVTKAAAYLARSIALARDSDNKALIASIEHSFGMLYAMQGHPDQAVKHLSSSIEVAAKIENKTLQASGYNAIGLMRKTLGENRRAAAAFEESIRIREEMHDTLGAEAPRANLGLILHEEGEFRKALIVYERSFAVFEAAGDTAGMAASLHNIGALKSELGYIGEALDDLQRALAMKLALGDTPGSAISYLSLGITYSMIPDNKKALECLRHSLELFETMGNRRATAQVLVSMGEVFWAMDKSETALERYIQSLKVAEEFGDIAISSMAHGGMGQVFWEIGDTLKALRHMEHSVSLAEQTANKMALSFSLMRLGWTYAKAGDDEQALSTFDRNLRIARELEKKRLEAGTLNAIGGIFSLRNDTAKAMQYLRRAMETAEAAEDMQNYAVALSNMGSIERTHGSDTLAERHLAQAVEIAKKMGALKMLSEMQRQLSRIASSRGDHKAAYQHLLLYGDARERSLNEARDRATREFAARYDAEKKDQQIALLQKDRQLQSLEIEQRKKELAFRTLQSKENRRRAELLASENLLQALTLRQKSTEFDLERAQKQRRLDSLRRQRDNQASIANRETLIRNFLALALLLLLALGFLVVKRIRAKRIEAMLRAESAEHQTRAAAYRAQVAEYQAQASESDRLRLQAETERQRREAQEIFSRRLIGAQEQERRRIAAELHDSLSQDLLVINNKALIGMNSIDDKGKVRGVLDTISTMASASLQDVRAITHNLRPHQLERLGLTETIRDALQAVAETAATRFTTAIANIDGLFPAEQEINVYRIVQESLNNILKHAHAAEAMLLVLHENGIVRIVIEDNGKGFDPATASPGIGLGGMSERVRMLGGSMSLKSAPGSGTSIRIELPVLRPPGEETAAQPGESSVSPKHEEPYATG